MGKELGDSRLVALSGRGRVFTQLLPQKFTHLGTMCAVICSTDMRGRRYLIMPSLKYPKFNYSFLFQESF